MMLYCGIDPGVTGGLAFVDAHGTVHLAVPMPGTERDVLDVLTKGIGRDTGRAILERVHSMPKQGHVGAFTFGKGYGALRMALTAAALPFDEVTPARWQQAMQCLSKRDKNITKRRAQQLFPTLTVTHAIADALLLAEYGRRLALGILVRHERPHGQKETRREEEVEPEQTLPGLEAFVERGQRAQRAVDEALAAQSGAARNARHALEQTRQPVRRHRR